MFAIKYNEKSYSCLNLTADLTRVSLAYKKLNQLPSRVSKYNFYRNTQVLDLSHNQIRNLTSLYRFQKLHSLILDHNKNLEVESMPRLPNLQLLWLNNCDIVNLSVWIKKIKECAPNLKYLSLMENPGSLCDKAEYRTCIISFLPALEYLDDTIVTKEERLNALMRSNSFGLTTESDVIYQERHEASHSDDDEFIKFEAKYTSDKKLN
uniref:CSON010289 protein n=1 Tax=Culicoides sonorensis TaxID=179676 RepID=A0A336M441_CULSO